VTTADIGFNRANLLFVDGNTGVEAAETEDAIERLQDLPGVTAVGAIAQGSPPLAAAGFRSGGATGTSIALAGQPPGLEALDVEIRSVSSGYFAAAGIPVLGGRAFDAGEVSRETAVAIDERTAAALFGQREAVGAEVVVGGSNRTVVAVAFTGCPRPVRVNPDRPVDRHGIDAVDDLQRIADAIHHL
jgi:prepilin-type processing-associated H-X9-DG protein